jgi:SsrA-binding protein
VSMEKGELWLKEMRIAPYAKAGKLETYHPTHARKILLRRQELRSLGGKMQQKGLTLVPMSLYPRGRHIKLRFALCRGRKAHDKRDVIKQRDVDRDLRRNLE